MSSPTELFQTALKRMALYLRMRIVLLDTSRAYFDAKTGDAHPTYIDLPPEAGAPPGTCAVL